MVAQGDHGQQRNEIPSQKNQRQPAALPGLPDRESQKGHAGCRQFHRAPEPERVPEENQIRLKRSPPVRPQGSRHRAVDMKHVLRGVIRREEKVEDAVQRGGREERQGAPELLTRAKERIGGGEQWKDYVALHRQEAGQKHSPGQKVVTAGAGFAVSQEKVQSQQQEESAKNLIVSRGPGHGDRQLAVGGPENRRQESRGPRTREPGGDRRRQRQVGELREEDPDPVGKRIGSEDGDRKSV